MYRTLVLKISAAAVAATTITAMLYKVDDPDCLLDKTSIPLSEDYKLISPSDGECLNCNQSHHCN